MHPRPVRQLPENDCRGDTLLESAKLPEEGQLDVSHLLDVTWQAGVQEGPQTSESGNVCRAALGWFARFFSLVGTQAVQHSINAIPPIQPSWLPGVM